MSGSHSTPATPFTELVADLGHEYARLHTAKEDAYWACLMGNAGDRAAARAELDRREAELTRFRCAPERLAAVREQLARARAAGPAAAPNADERLALEGFEAYFAAHVIENAEARALQEEIAADEGKLAEARAGMRLGYRDPASGFAPASSVKLGVLVATDPDEAVRRAAFDGLRSIEDHVLEHGFLDLVRKRNRLGRLLGGEDFYDATVRRTEGMGKAEVFALLDELEQRTRAACERSLRELARTAGAGALAPWNVRFVTTGDSARALDPHFPFALSLERWLRSFAALGVDYAGAELVLDLLDRSGKYENGFMHGPVPAWRDRGVRIPARIQFTANAIPGMVGAGKRATETLFHEGGHAAHFANIDMPAPCFAQEWAPTSVPFAETQSMFMDRLLSDGDWQRRYALTRDGAPPSDALLEQCVRAAQPFAAFGVRSMLAVCYAEKALYELPERELTAERARAAVRDVERRLTQLPAGSPRPVLSVPHLLAGESSAYYHGYVLAELAVFQTRAFFRSRDGRLVDNPRIGNDLREHYWREGNRLRFGEFVERMTGRPLTAAPLAEAVGRTADERLEVERRAIAALGDAPAGAGSMHVNARIRVVDGNEIVAEDRDPAALAAAFARWIDRLAPP